MLLIFLKESGGVLSHGEGDTRLLENIKFLVDCVNEHAKNAPFN